MTETRLRKPSGELLAVIRTSDSGMQRIYDAGGMFRGMFNPAMNSTYDSGGMLVGRGNMLAALV